MDADRLRKCSPTLSVIYEENEEFAWVSVYNSGSELRFVSEAHFPGEVSSWFGFSKKMGTVSLSHDALSYDQAKEVITLFSAKEYEALKSLYESAS